MAAARSAGLLPEEINTVEPSGSGWLDGGHRCKIATAQSGRGFGCAATRAPNMLSMKKPFTLLACTLIAATVGTGCSRSEGNRTVLHRETEISELEARINGLRDALALERSRPAAPAPQPAPRDTMADDLAGTGATVSRRGDEMVITVGNEILFASGSANLTNNAKTALARIVRVINQRYPGKQIRVVGHTDNEPIVRTRDRWSDNWDLSAARSLSVLRELISAGISEDRIHFAGFGEFQPLVSNNTRENRARNRRVEIIVLDAR
ncbi:MAG: OmpA family protein [Planctomycetota bacterium]|nr:MAG: OmpA family protein [Planctomycetota bacterium]